MELFRVLRGIEERNESYIRAGRPEKVSMIMQLGCLHGNPLIRAPFFAPVESRFYCCP